MMEAIDTPDEICPNAPRIITVKIPVDKIGEVIGPKGKMINQIQEDTGAEITIEDDGTHLHRCRRRPGRRGRPRHDQRHRQPDHAGGRRALPGHRREDDDLRRVRVAAPGQGRMLLHISQIRKLTSGKRVENVEDVLGVGQKVQVEIAEIDSRGKLFLIPVIEGEGDDDKKDDTDQ